MKVTLPIKTRDEFTGGKRIIEYADKTFELDVSLEAQGRWERKFPELSKNEDLLIYSERISAEKELTPAKVISRMKVLYCYLVTDLGFIEFLRMFDMSIPSHTKKLIDRLTQAFEAISEAASEKN